MTSVTDESLRVKCLILETHTHRCLPGHRPVRFPWRRPPRVASTGRRSPTSRPWAAATTSGPGPTPAGAFERAREYLRAGRRIDMVALAADLGVARATLYRWTGDRERLMADAVWAEALADRRAHPASAIRKKGLAAHPGGVRRTSSPTRADNEGVNAFVQHERGAGLELLTRVNGGFRPRLVAWIRRLIEAEIDAGTLPRAGRPRAAGRRRRHDRGTLPPPRRRPRRHPRPGGRRAVIAVLLREER